MKSFRPKTSELGSTRRDFLRTGAGALLAASCLNSLEPAKLAAAPTPPANNVRAAVYVCPPCGQPCDKLEFDKPGVCPQCGMTLVEKSEVDAAPSVAILLFDRAEIID